MKPNKTHQMYEGMLVILIGTESYFFVSGREVI